ncbi:DUF4747 family protein [Chromobacterium haemolyticum]|uniref:DUF4747 family protein n=1 Tax=Chromobacterium haemolyticum TaxID=394935 RepID=UPI000D31BF46|nr:DUF4747 family protein [Chromobacterium haemolyticum]PTU70148.1 hypothetical protein DBB33_12205 [Chromobacterium haemolyticum]
MANKKLYSICAVNIRVHPHPKGRYEELLRDVMNMRRSVSVYGMHHVLMTMIRKDEMVGKDVLYGMLAKYTRIKVDGRWFNEATMKVAGEDELMEINIPDNLQPNLNEFRFMLLPDSHVIFVEFEADGERMAPAHVGKYFENVFSADAIRKKFGVVDVTVIPVVSAVSEMLSLPLVKKIELKIRRPNPDDFDDINPEDFEEEMLEIMDDQNIAEIREHYIARPGVSVVLNNKTKMKADLAARNGEVLVFGRNAEGERVTLSSQKMPMIERGYFGVDFHGYGAFVDLVLKMLPKVLVRRNV